MLVNNIGFNMDTVYFMWFGLSRQCYFGGMRAGRSRACRMKSVDRGREMPLELSSARSQHLHATAGVCPCRMHFSFILASFWAYWSTRMHQVVT